MSAIYTDTRATAPARQERQSDTPTAPRAVRASVRETEGWSGRVLWPLVALVPALALVQSQGMNTIDAWWNLALGRIMLSQHRLVIEDGFAFTPGVPGVINQQWLAQLTWAAADQLGGPTAMLGLRTLAVAATLLTMWIVGRNLGASRRALVAAALLSTLLMASNFGIRAQTLALPLAALMLWALQRGRLIGWLAVPISIVWANVHGSFPLGLAFAVSFAVGNSFVHRDRGRAVHDLLIAIGVGLGTVVTPYGPQVWWYAVDLSTNAALRSMLAEWQPITLQTFAGQVFYAEFAAAVTIFLRRRPSIPVTWLVLAAGLTIFGLTAIRNGVWLGLPALPLWALILHRCSGRFADHPTSRRTRWVMVVGLTAVALATILRTPLHQGTGGAGEQADPEVALSELSNYLVDHPDGRLFHDANWGGYLEAHLNPLQQVFIDTRVELHPATVWDDYVAVTGGRFDWQAILARYDIERVALDPHASPQLERALRSTAVWQQVWITPTSPRTIEVWQRSAPP